MDHHGTEFYVYLVFHAYEVSVWPAVIIFAIWFFREQERTGILAFMKKIEDLIELRVGGQTAQFKPAREKVSPASMGVVISSDTL